MFARLFPRPKPALAPAHLAGETLAALATRCEQLMQAGRFDAAWSLVQGFDATTLDVAEYGRFAAFAGHVELAATADVAAACARFEYAFASGYEDRHLLINALLPCFEAGHLERVAWIEARLAADYAEEAEARFARAYLTLARGDYPAGFALAEARYAIAEAAHSISPWLTAKPRWQGEPLAGKRLLVHAEQGLGDAVMMARYLPRLVAQGAEVLVDCRPPLHALFAENFPDCHLLVGEVGRSIEAPFDLWTGMMSLPHHFGAMVDGFPARAGYLRPPAEAAAYWRVRVAELAPTQPRIGLCWSGNPVHPADRRRSLPFALLAAHLPGSLRFFALQTEVPSARPASLIDLSEELMTLADTAALIDEMDLVITVDSSPVHLAGALGKPTWLLLPHRYEWRWGMGGEENPWYDSVRVLRQATPGDWEGVLAETFGRRLPSWLAERGG